MIKTIRFLATSLALTLPLVACAEDPKDSKGEAKSSEAMPQPPTKEEVFTPLFPGLNGGTQLGECYRLGEIALRITTQDLEQKLSLHSGANCLHDDSHQTSRSIAITSQLAGLWGEYIVFEDGSGPDSRELVLLEGKDLSEVARFEYTGEAEFNATHLLAYRSTGKPAETCECSDKESYAEWVEMGFEVELIQQFEVSTKDLKPKTTSKKSCQPLQ